MNAAGMTQSGDRSPLVLAIDQGTTGTTAVVSTPEGRALSRANAELPNHFPTPGRVEQMPEEIWRSVLAAVDAALEQLPGSRERLAAIGITNQRETMLLWDSDTGEALGPALVWQDRRTSARCTELLKAGHGARVREVTGLVIDPYFSATKLAWSLERDAELRHRAERGQVQFGTVDSFLVKRLAGGAHAPHLIEVTNAGRTLLMDLKTRCWSSEMCQLFGVPEAVLPQIVPSAGRIAVTEGVPGLPDGLPISGIAGDQHAALFGQGCVRVGEAKCTYGTGAFVLVNTGEQVLTSESGLLSTLAWQIGDEVSYALEGASFIAGAAVQWLRDGLGLIASASDIEALASTVRSTEGVMFVPALSGLGAPYWDPEAQGLISGLTRGSTKAHLARATLEAIALQVDDLLRAMAGDLETAGLGPLSRLAVDGGASANNLLLSMQAELSGVQVMRPGNIESTARGAALLAAVGAGLLSGAGEAAEAVAAERVFAPGAEPAVLDGGAPATRLRWDAAVRRARSTH